MSMDRPTVLIMMDPTEPDAYAPPRQVYEWTVVPGHDPRIQRREADGILVGSCTCGVRESGVSRGWRDEHLANAWPVLIPREPGETVESWCERLVAELDEARAEDGRLSSALAARMAVKSGEAYPVIGEADIAASQRVEVLEHQLAQAPFAQAPFGRLGDLG